MEHGPAEETAALFERFRDRGDTRALTEVFDRTAPELLALAGHLTRDVAEAEDLLQECFLVAIQKARRWDPSRPLLPWLAGILIREARKQRRRASRRAPDDGRAAGSAPEASRAAIDGELREAVESALERLPPKYAEVLHAHLFEGVPAREIAVRLGRAPGTVRVQLHRGFELLRRALPRGLALGALAVCAPRGLGAVRRAVSAQAAAHASTAAAAGTALSALSTLAPLAVKTKTWIVASMLALAGAGALWIGTDSASGVREAEPAADVAQDAGPAPAVRAQTLTPETRRSEASHDVDGPVSARAAPEHVETDVVDVRHVVLRGVLHAEPPPEPTEFELEVSVRHHSDRSVHHTLHGPGSFEVALDALTTPSEAHGRELLVIVRAEGYRPYSAYVGHESPTGDPLVFSVELKPARIRLTLRGRLLDANSGVPERPYVGFLPTRSRVPLQYQSMNTAQVDDEGRFELSLVDEEGDGGLLLAIGEGHASIAVDPWTTEAALAADDVLDLGDLVLEPGARISGVATREGSPMPAHSEVHAVLPYRPSPFSLQSHDLVLEDGRLARRAAEARVDADGRFELLGLEPGLEYHLVVVPYGEFPAYRALDAVGTPTRAPADGVQLDWGLRPLRLLVRSAGDPVPEPRVRATVPPDDPRRVLPAMMWGGFEIPVRGDGEGLVELWIARRGALHLDVSAPGHESREVLVDPTILPQDGEFVVELAPGDETAELVVRLLGPDPEETTGGSAYLIPIDTDRGLDLVGPITVTDGVARFEDLVPGAGQVAFHLILPTRQGYDTLPFFDSDVGSIEIEPLRPGERREIPLELPIGGRIELRLVGRDPALPPPELEVLDEAGTATRPQLLAPAPHGHETREAWTDDGPCLLGSSLPPGRYTVRQVGEAYAEDELELVVRERAVTRATFSLRPR